MLKLNCCRLLLLVSSLQAHHIHYQPTGVTDLSHPCAQASIPSFFLYGCTIYVTQYQRFLHGRHYSDCLTVPEIWSARASMDSFLGLYPCWRVAAPDLHFLSSLLSFFYIISLPRFFSLQNLQLRKYILSLESATPLSLFHFSKIFPLNPRLWYLFCSTTITSLPNNHFTHIPQFCINRLYQPLL